MLTSHWIFFFRMLKGNIAQVQRPYKACEMSATSINGNKCTSLYMLLNFTGNLHARLQILWVQELCLNNAPENRTDILTLKPRHNIVTVYSKHVIVPVGKHHVRGYSGGLKKKLHTFLDWHHVPVALPHMERNPSTHCIKGSVDPTASLEIMVVKDSLPLLENEP
jgi:hypothetical protein